MKESSTDPEVNENDDQFSDEFNTIDDMLTDFFFNSIKLGPSLKSINDNNLNEVTDNVQIVLDLLQVNFILPKNYHDNPHLDSLDKKILENLAEKQNKSLERKPTIICYNNKNLDEIFSPNINTLIGLRSLLINHRLYKQNTKYFLTEISWSVEKYVKEMSVTRKVRFKVETDLFFKRFKALFKWPSILTLHEPNISLLNSLKIGHVGNNTKTRTYGSKKRTLINTDMQICKKPRIIDISVPSTSDNSGFSELSDLEKLQRVLSTQNDLTDESDNDSDSSEVITGL